MKAVRFHQFGGPEVLRYKDLPVPALQPGEVRVRVRAVGLNPADWYLRDGYQHKRLPDGMIPRQLGDLGRLLDEGTVRIAIDGAFPLHDAVAAHQRAEQGHIRGKLVLTVS